MSTRGPRILSIDGIIGAGKTTIIDELKKDYPCFTEPIDDWGCLLDKFYKNMKKYSLPFQLQVLFSQFKQLNTINNTIQHGKVVFIERSPETSRHVFFQMLADNFTFRREELNVYHSMYTKLAYLPACHIVLDITPEVAFKRIKKRGRKEESSITIEYLTDLYNKYKKHYTNRTDVVWIDGTENAEFIVRLIKRIAINFEN